MENDKRNDYIDLGLALYTRHATSIPLSTEGQQLLDKIKSDDVLVDELLSTLQSLCPETDDITFSDEELTVIIGQLQATERELATTMR